MKKAIRARDWCFTSFEVTAPELKGGATYVCQQKEICPTTQRKHFQGYIEFKEKMSLTGLKKLYGDKIHWGPRKGTQAQAIDYCKKSDTAVPNTFSELGKKKEQGARSDLDAILNAMEDGWTTSDILREFGGNALRHISHIERGLNALWGRSTIDQHIRSVRHETNLLRVDNGDNVNNDLIDELQRPQF